jgi:hypothetical protein
VKQPDYRTDDDQSWWQALDDEARRRNTEDWNELNEPKENDHADEIPSALR